MLGEENRVTSKANNLTLSDLFVLAIPLQNLATFMYLLVILTFLDETLAKTLLEL